MLAVEQFVPLALVGHALRKLHAAHFSVRVRIVIEDGAAILQLMDAEKVQLGVLIHGAPLSNEFESVHWSEHELVAVAAPTHPTCNCAGADHRGRSAPSPPACLDAALCRAG